MTASATQRNALLRLGAASAEAVANTLEMFAPGQVTRGDVQILSEEQKPFSAVAPGTVAADVSYVEGVTGGNVFLAPTATARALATLMGAGEAPDPEAELSELELSAVSEASNQMMAAAAMAIGAVLGQEIEISPPRCTQIDSAEDADTQFGRAPYVTVATFTIGGEPCRLVQLVPGSFVTRVGRALEELDGDAVPADGETAAGATTPIGLHSALEGINLRVWAELGRVQLPLGEALALPPGAIVELDRAVEEPADLFVNGVALARGRLLVDGDGRWAFQLDSLTNDNHSAPDASQLAPLTKGD